MELVADYREFYREVVGAIDKLADQLPVSCAVRWPAFNPTPPDSGTASLGMVGRAARWLLETESTPLTLVVGMIGFGFLGAAFSTFVREQGQRVREQGQRGAGTSGPLVDDLSGVVIRGISAAVVVFLGIYGGLALVSSGAEPDPYVMFFLCLVGAVFSETVWTWARGRLADQLMNDEAAIAAEAARSAAEGGVAGSRPRSGPSPPPIIPLT